MEAIGLVFDPPREFGKDNVHLILHLSLSHHRHRHHGGSSLSLATTAPSSGLSPTVLNALPHFRLKRTQYHHRNNNSDVTVEGDDDCIVCLNAFKDTQWCRKLSACGHVFHMRCVNSWHLFDQMPQ